MTVGEPLSLAQGVRFRRVLDEGVMLRIDAGEIVGVNGVGARILELVLAGGADRARLAAALHDEMEVADETDVAADVDRFVEELLALGALREGAAP